MLPLTISLLVIAVLGAGLALVLSVIAQKSKSSSPMVAGNTDDGDETVIDLSTSDNAAANSPTPWSHARSELASSQTVASTPNDGLGSLAVADPPASNAQADQGPYTKLSPHQGRKLGADKPIWRRALSGIALLLIVVLIGVTIAAAIGLAAALASLLVERAV